MSLFEQYMYVLACGDGSLYTGYSTDVAVRLAAHRAGRGARYTKTHAPVRLVAQARFYSKQRAMSAEARFKRLGRAEKDRLLSLAKHEPFEDVLRRELPGFGEDTAQEYVHRSLSLHAEPEFARFQARLIPTVDAGSIVGVRAEELRRIARGLVRRDDAEAFLSSLPHQLFEEMQVHAIAIGLEKDYETALSRYEAFLPFVDNWATCDKLSVGVLGRRPEETLGRVEDWLAEGRCYPMRFAIRVLMELFLGERFDPRLMEAVADAHMPERRDEPALADDVYYLNMMRAWYFAEAMVRQPEWALAYLERSDAVEPLDEWTRRKAIQKAIESFRVPALLKERLRGAR